MGALIELFGRAVSGNGVYGDCLLDKFAGSEDDEPAAVAIPESAAPPADPPAPAGLTREDVAALLDAAGERLAGAVANLPAPVVNVTVQAPEPKPQRAVFERGPDGRIESASLEPAD